MNAKILGNYFCLDVGNDLKRLLNRTLRFIAYIDSPHFSTSYEKICQMHRVLWILDFLGKHQRVIEKASCAGNLHHLSMRIHMKGLETSHLTLMQGAAFSRLSHREAEPREELSSRLHFPLPHSLNLGVKQPCAFVNQTQ